MARTVLLHPGAYTDLRQHTRYIAHRVPPASATRWQTAIEATIARLATNTKPNTPNTEATELGIDLRVLLHGRRPHVYRILFTIDGDTVNVLRVRHAAQDRLAPDDV